VLGIATLLAWVNFAAGFDALDRLQPNAGLATTALVTTLIFALAGLIVAILALPARRPAALAALLPILLVAGITALSVEANYGPDVDGLFSEETHRLSNVVWIWLISVVVTGSLTYAVARFAFRPPRDAAGGLVAAMIAPGSLAVTAIILIATMDYQVRTATEAQHRTSLGFVLVCVALVAAALRARARSAD
jgi:hypothetical protein